MFYCYSSNCFQNELHKITFKTEIVHKCQHTASRMQNFQICRSISLELTPSTMKIERQVSGTV